jgi:hypothetical protein
MHQSAAVSPVRSKRPAVDLPERTDGNKRLALSSPERTGLERYVPLHGGPIIRFPVGVMSPEPDCITDPDSDDNDDGDDNDYSYSGQSTKSGQDVGVT